MTRPDRYAGQGEPKNLTSIEGRLRQLARDTGDDERRLRHRLSVVVLCVMLGQVVLTDSGERLLVKGGSAMMLRFGLNRSRFSKDLDAALRGQVDQFVQRLRERGRTAYHGWTFTVAKVETIEVPGMVAKPRRITLKMAFKTKPYSTVQLEIAPEEGDSASDYDTVFSSDMADLGFEAEQTVQQIMTVPWQTAQKLHACTTPRSDGKPNDRAHDLVDLALLAGPIREDLPSVRAACVQIFGIRQTTWPPALTPEADWPRQYEKAAEDLTTAVPATLDDAVALVRDIILEIDAAQAH